METITIHVNGTAQQVAVPTLSELFKNLNIDLQFLAVAVNNTVIPSAEYGKTPLKQGDQIEIIKPVCGG